MDYLSKIFRNKDKKIGFQVLFIFSLGLLMILASNYLFQTNEREEEIGLVPEKPPPLSEQVENYESILERRLEEAFSQVAGVGRVKVMVRLAVGKEIVVAEDHITEESTTIETDGAGGNREVTSRKAQDSTVILQRSGINEPLIVKELEPQIEGVIIVAEGGGDIVIQDMLIKACESLLGVATHKVQILKMK